ncbi:DOMON-like domain-containing protein [Bdellovibrio bacteriovorus]|uniref:DOMON-like domain-containing protein n=1 Tax=Bdellovibrio bacteriovorus TaxID=959 RepID=UPI0021D1C433|nr:DOMON-like domain-containing protein [Bdellovibrio bacteriovorus]UXR63127.1 DOMON-like domain-containing protein [Bdellovibrio bacteriovorus]
MKSLKPFSKTALTESISVQGDITPLADNRLLVKFKIAGNIERILWPKAATQISREDGLWKHTCLEAFVGTGSTPRSPYLEVNCAPNGHWNAYSFSSYREDMQPALDTRVRLQHHEPEQQEALFEIEIDSQKPFDFTCLGLTAVIEFTDGSLSYWSLSHPGSDPDFHNKDGWIALSTH